ncbi:hypothetical protein C1E37_10280 [Salmonella enterica subsp. enterica serovar Kentucky]|nr:hypothetical protein [Salmonella enterica subsp. enterica serovar Kentucky]
MDKTAALASDILRGIGGEQNILRLENCMTRVRVEVQDDSQLDIPRLKALPGVSGYVKQGEQHQLIVGPGKAAQVVDAMRVQITAGGVKPDDAMARTKSEAKAKYKAPMSDALRKLANVFIPLIPAFIASGLITGIINILKRPDIVGDVAVHYPNLLGLMGIFGSAVFAIMNILVGVNTAKVFGGSQALGGVMAGILSSPQLAQITLFGEPLIFGVTLPLGKPFIGACLGGAVGGALISYWKVATVITFGISGLPLALTIVAGKVLFYLLGYLIAVIAGFIFTWLLGFNDPEE